MTKRDTIIYLIAWVLYAFVSGILLVVAIGIGYNIVLPVMTTTTLAGILPGYAELVSLGGPILVWLAVALYNLPEKAWVRKNKKRGNK